MQRSVIIFLILLFLPLALYSNEPPKDDLIKYLEIANKLKNEINKQEIYKNCIEELINSKSNLGYFVMVHQNEEYVQ